MKYDARSVEKKWQSRWAELGIFEAEPDPASEKFYCLEMLPYPSGILHMGHVRNYSIGDAVAWFERMRGKSVLHVIGWDAMGLPAENAAIKNGVAPAEWTYRNITQMREQLRAIGFGYDWRREIATCHPGYYRWNQWFFLKMLERDLVYRARRTLNWCPKCDTVLANEQVTPSGTCWRHEETTVSSVELDQWFIRTTSYAERLLAGLERIAPGWPERVIAMQRNWIGRSEGCRFSFRVVDGGPAAGEEIEVFSTRVDTVYGCSAIFLAPEHPLVSRLIDGTGAEASVRRFVEDQQGAANQPDEEREKQGVPTGRSAINPFNGEEVPIWVANFVLAEFGTGAVFAQPAHDQRDFEFARKYGLEVRPVIGRPGEDLPSGASLDEALTEEGVVGRSGPFSGLESAEARRRMTEYALQHGFGKSEVQYRLRDWGVSRQRYWGTPIPIVYCDACGVVPVPEHQLPVLLPEIEDWRGTTGSPLARCKQFVETECPRCGSLAKRETDTMDTFVDSSWYFLRYLDPRNEELPFDRESADYWMPVDLYIGGVEHAVGHLIYARFWTMVLSELGMLEVDEPAARLFTQGMINAATYRCPTHDFVAPKDVHRGEEGESCPKCGQLVDVRIEKMSKSKLNSVGPEELAERYGADALRLFVLFGGPPVKDLEWTEQGIEGTYRFVQRVARLADRLERVVRKADAGGGKKDDEESLSLRRRTHRTIMRVTRDIDGDLQLNTAIAALMELVNDLYRVSEGRELAPDTPTGRAAAEAMHTLALLLAPFAPHLAEELNARLGGDRPVALSRWPVPDPTLLIEDTIEIPVQINGKLRGQVVVVRGAGEENVLETIRSSEAVARHLEGKSIVRVIHVPDRLVNLVVRDR